MTPEEVREAAAKACEEARDAYSLEAARRVEHGAEPEEVYAAKDQALAAIRCAAAIRALQVEPTPLDTSDRRAVEAAFPLMSRVRVVRSALGSGSGSATGTDGRSRGERFPLGSVEVVRGYDHYAGAWRLLVDDNKGWVLECGEVEALPLPPPSEGEAALLDLARDGLRWYMRDWSEEAYCAGWMSGLPYAMWAKDEKYRGWVKAVGGSWDWPDSGDGEVFVLGLHLDASRRERGEGR